MLLQQTWRQCENFYYSNNGTGISSSSSHQYRLGLLASIRIRSVYA